MKTPASVGLIVVPIASCVAVPLLAAGVGVAVAAWIGGIAVGGIVLLSASVVLGLRLRRRARDQFPSLPTERSRT